MPIGSLLSWLVGASVAKSPFNYFLFVREKNFERAELAAFQSVQSFALSEKYQSINQPLLAFHRKRNSLTKEARFREDIKREVSFSLRSDHVWVSQVFNLDVWKKRTKLHESGSRGGKKTQLELVECDRNWIGNPWSNVQISRKRSWC